MSEELFQKLKSQQTGENKKESQKKSEKETYLIFKSGQKFCALLSKNVKEIIRDSQVYPLPFAPGYLSGVLNRYGDPYAVVDPMLMMGQESQKASVYIVLNDEGHSCFKITDVLDFYDLDEGNIKRFPENGKNEYVEGTFTFNDKEVILLNEKAFLEKLVKDIELS